MIDLIVLQGCSTIQLTRGQNTLVDSRDLPKLAEHAWHAFPSDSSYYAVRTARDGPGGKHTIRMHRIVLGTHVGPCPPGLECRHLNGDSLDNRSGNLEWGTHIENVRDAIRHGSYERLSHNSAGKPNPHTRGERNASARLKPSDIPEIFRAAAAGETQASIARRYGVSGMAIWKILEGKSWSHVTSPSGEPIRMACRPKRPRISRAEAEERIKAVYAEIGPIGHEPSNPELARRIGANRRTAALVRNGMIASGRLEVPMPPAPATRGCRQTRPTLFPVENP